MRVYADVESLLRAYDLQTAHEQPFAHGGFSGAQITRIVGAGGAAFVLKRMSMERDWIMRATDDTTCRELELAAAASSFGAVIRTPTVATARDGGGFALLMRDITPDLIPPGPITRAQLKTIIEGMVELHRMPLAGASVSWCDLRQRLMLLTPETAMTARSYGAPVASDVQHGWARFDVLAPPRARSAMHANFSDVAPLVRALNELPSVFLHGDLKLDNIGLTTDGRIWLIDWALTLLAPPAVELGWFLAINSQRLPASLDEVMSMYADAASIPEGVRVAHDRLTILCGLLLRGWRKALDADAGERDELQWWCDRAEAALDIL